MSEVAAAATGSGGSAVQIAASTSATGVGGSSGAGGSGAESTCGAVDGVALAVDELFVGERTFAGVKSATAWKEYGFDLDGITTTASGDFSKICKPYGNSASSVLEDGSNGRDNSFGRNVLTALSAFVPSFDAQANDAIGSGQFTEIFLFEQLGADGNADPVVTKLLGGAELGSTPAWKGDDCWPILHEELTDPKDPTSAKSIFPNAKLLNNVWDSGGTADLILPLNVLGQPIAVKVYQARATASLDATHKGAALGQIGGYVKTEELVQTVRQAAGAINPTYCQLFDATVAEQLRAASDIMDDGTQDPTKTCNAISVGLGFTLLQVQFGKIANAAMTATDPCK
jgi:hypothetical protein